MTIDRVCSEEARSSPELRCLLDRSDRPLRSSDDEMLEKLRGLGVDLDRRGPEKLCEGALSAEEAVGALIAGRGAGTWLRGRLDLDLPGHPVAAVVAGQGTS